MNISFETPISALALHPTISDKICMGFLDGGVGCYNFNPKDDLKRNWLTKLKKSVRAVRFSHDGSSIFAASSNRAVCMYDTETGKRTRCIREGHRSRPNELSLFPSLVGSAQQFVTGAENGEIKSWDFGQAKPHIATFNEQDDIINSFGSWKNTLLAVSGDGTLAAYDLYKNSLRMQSETMHSELLTLAVTNEFVYAGSADGHIEVFGNGEFGNIRERIETPFSMGVEQLLVVKKNLLIASASTKNEMRFIHLNPNKSLDAIPCAGAIDLLAKTSNSSLLLVTTADGANLKTHNLQELLKDVIELRAQDMHKFKQEQKERRKRQKLDDGDFFTDMMSDQVSNNGSDDN